MEWTEDETRELIALWPTNSATQIAKRLQRPTAAITGKAKRLRDEGLLPVELVKHYENKPVQRPRKSGSPHETKQPHHMMRFPAAPLDGMQPCSLLELDGTRCRWPLGETQEVAALFCGGMAAANRPYCSHHLRLARGNRA